jgi:hypothetical protein
MRPSPPMRRRLRRPCSRPRFDDAEDLPRRLPHAARGLRRTAAQGAADTNRLHHGGARAARYGAWGCGVVEHGPRGWPAARVRRATNRPRKGPRGWAARQRHVHTRASHASRAYRSTESRTQPELTPDSRRQQCSTHFSWRKGGHWPMF